MTRNEWIKRYGEDSYKKKLERNLRSYHNRTNNHEFREHNNLKAKSSYYDNLEARRTYYRERKRKEQRYRFVINGRIDLVENYELAKADDFKGWHIHHKDEIRTLPSGMTVIRTRQDLIDNNRYYNCPPNELIWLTIGEHTKIHKEKHYESI